MARKLSRCFDADPSLRPPTEHIGHPAKEEEHRIALSSAQEAQIRDMFNLFDTDGGGSIDRKELEFALDALGFRDMRSKKVDSSTTALVENILADGAMSLDEFSAVMMGVISGRGPLEDVKAAFAVLSRSDGLTEHDRLITLSKVQAANQEVEVLELVGVGVCVCVGGGSCWFSLASCCVWLCVRFAPACLFYLFVFHSGSMCGRLNPKIPAFAVSCSLLKLASLNRLCAAAAPLSVGLV